MEPLWVSAAGDRRRLLRPGVDSLGSQRLEFGKQQPHLFFETMPGLGDAVEVPRLSEVVHTFGGLKWTPGGEETHRTLDTVG